ncbi:hypothetical protein ABVK25_005833 [Lepraria finkii]|uniref:Uncharacterized protein n=1 Tax=Lepraria finkii TaxID=1340010 RepID=A0ABR4B7T3_9LECA
MANPYRPPGQAPEYYAPPTQAPGQYAPPTQQHPPHPSWTSIPANPTISPPPPQSRQPSTYTPFPQYAAPPPLVPPPELQYLPLSTNRLLHVQNGGLTRPSPNRRRHDRGTPLHHCQEQALPLQLRPPFDYSVEPQQCTSLAQSASTTSAMTLNSRSMATPLNSFVDPFVHLMNLRAEFRGARR